MTLPERNWIYLKSKLNAYNIIPIEVKSSFINLTINNIHQNIH